MSESYFQRAIKEWSETTPPGGVSWPIWIANRAEAAESRAAQLEGDKAIAEFTVLKQYALEMQADLATARADIGRYQDERVSLLGRLEVLAAELQEQSQLIEQLKEQLPMVSL